MGALPLSAIRKHSFNHNRPSVVVYQLYPLKFQKKKNNAAGKTYQAIN